MLHHLLPLFLVAQLCGDCDRTGTVTIAELVHVVGNALDPPCVFAADDECSNCPGGTNGCVELWELDGWQCAAQVCFTDETQLRRCTEALKGSLCFEVEP